MNRKWASSGLKSWGLCPGFAPRPPGFIAFVPELIWAAGARVARSRSVPAPGSALRSHPGVALSSPQASSSIGPERRSCKRDEARLARSQVKLRQAAKAISRILFHLPCKVVTESSSGKGTGTPYFRVA